MENKNMDEIKNLILISEGKTITAQSQLQGYDACNVLDGRKDTYWKALPYYQWLKLDLKSCYSVTGIQLDLGTQTDRYYHYYIEYSCDNLNWELALEKMDNTIEGRKPVNYDVEIYARYFRITMTYCSVGMSVQIRDLKVFGYEKYIECGQRCGTPGFKMAAVYCDDSQGFHQKGADDIEPGQQEDIMCASCVGSYLKFRQVDFTDKGVDQLRGNFGFPCKDREKLIAAEIRLDRIEGELIGKLLMFRQYTPWTILACDIKKEDGTPVAGVHDVFFIITADAQPQELMVHWLSFVRKSPLPTSVPRKQEPLISENGQYEIYFGNMHSHTGFSDGKAVPEYAYDYARYEAGLDFLGVTEHSNLFDEAFDYDKSRKWADLRKFANEKTVEGAFLALIGSETTWYNQFGHMNIYNVDFYLNPYELKYNDVKQYYDTVKQYPDSISQWNHPWSCGDRHLDYFEPYDKELDKVLYTVEINHMESPESGGLFYYVSALDKGWHVSPVGNQDNHNDQWGTQNHLRTAALMEKLTTEHFYDAIQNNRVYFTCAVHLKIWFWVNGFIMGSRIKRAEKYSFHFKAQNQADESPIVKAEIIGEHGAVLHSFELANHEADCTIALPFQEKYYFLKVYQANDEFAATSPVWIEEE